MEIPLAALSGALIIRCSIRENPAEPPLLPQKQIPGDVLPGIVQDL
jgi:hypothetical protein